jgi:hypothetical protein
MLKKPVFQKILNEILWLSLIAIVCIGLLYPIVNLGEYKFLWQTIMFIGIAILYSRWVVFFKEIDYLKNKWVKVFIFLLNFQVIIFTVNRLQEIIPLWETQSLLEFLYHIKRELSLDRTVFFLAYIKNVVLVSGISSCVAIVFLSVRIFSSFFSGNKIRKQEMLNDLK